MLKDIEPFQIKAGDEVLFCLHYPKDDLRYAEILTVTKVTSKAGQITTSDGSRFDKDGFELGGSTSLSGGRNTICMLTPELRVRFEYAQNVDYIIRYLEPSKLTRDAASKIVAILKAKEEENHANQE